MSRLTITLSDERYRALKEAAAQRGRTIGQLIDESLEFYGIKSCEHHPEPSTPRGHRLPCPAVGDVTLGKASALSGLASMSVFTGSIGMSGRLP